MRLAAFIRGNRTKIVAEWAEFARGVVPGMNLEELRDHVVGMLDAVAIDLDTPQSKQEQTDKSKGPDAGEPAPNTAASAHGFDRASFGYTPGQMMAEFRALRASVLRLWSAVQTEFSRDDLEDVTRFNEAIDQLLAESVATYTLDVANSKDLMLGVLGHDLRTPLGAIMMTASTMMTREGPDWPQLKSAARIVKCVTRMDEMIRDLVDFTRSRLGAGIPIVRGATDLAVVCQQTVDEITAFHPQCTVTFESTGLVQGAWDGGRVAQVLSNLIGNARQHGRDGVPIAVRLRGEDDGVVLTVHNQGPVIAPDQVASIFDPFRQLAASPTKARDPQSAGLGLYIVKAIVTAHDGTIAVASDAGGTTFTICLPRE